MKIINDFSVSRRNALKLFGGVTASLAAPGVMRKAYAQESFSVGMPGGYQQAFQTAYLTPFEKEFGIKGTPILAGQSNVEIKAQVQNGKFFYDVRFSVASPNHDILSKAGLLEPITVKSDNIQAIYDYVPEKFRQPTRVPHGLLATVIAHQANVKFDTYADIWDVAGHKGQRALRGLAVETVEATLRSIGIAPGETASYLASEDGWKKVFKRLDEVKPNIATWWDDETQAARLLGSGDTDVTAVSQHRVIGVIRDGGKVNFTYNQGWYDLMGWVIPKNSPKAEIGQKFIDFCSRPDRMAEFTKQIPMGPVHPKVPEFLDTELAKLLPSSPENVGKIAPVDTVFWGQNQDRANERFREWLFG